MDQASTKEVAALGGDPTDPTWHWLLKRGPHGPTFTWGQTKSEPPGYVGVEHLRQIVEEKAASDRSFADGARAVVTAALQSKHTEILRRAIQVAAVLGNESDLKVVTALTAHEDNSVAADARASVFYLKKRLKSLTR